MEILNVIVAAIGAFALGSVWYMVLAEEWMVAAGVPRGEDGRPKGGMSIRVFAAGFVMQLLVAGMMRHVFETGAIDSVGKAVVTGAGIGLFFITPWIALNNLYAMRPLKLTVIDGGYATLACAVIGFVLALF